MRIYIAGPYRAQTPSDIDRNILAAREAMAELFLLGHTPFCPHSMTSRCERDFPAIPEDVYLRTDLEWLALCDAILMLPGWEQSSGSRAELQAARERAIPEFYSVNDVPQA